MKNKKEVLKNLPGVDKLLLTPPIRELIKDNNEELIKFVIRDSLSHLRKNPPQEINESGKNCQDLQAITFFGSLMLPGSLFIPTLAELPSATRSLLKLLKHSEGTTILNMIFQKANVVPGTIT